MVLPIVGYGSTVLRKKAQEIKKDYPNLAQTIIDMFDTLDKSDGIGLAAPQIDKSIRLFVIDANGLKEDHPNLPYYKRAFINPKILDFSEESINYNEGCLSVPEIWEDVKRPAAIKVQYFDEEWQLQEETLSGLLSRIFQHEFDHLEGIIFTDRISPLKKKLIKNRLEIIMKGKIQVRYRMKLANA